MASERSRQLWDAGVILSEAWTAFAVPDEVGAFENAPDIWQSLIQQAPLMAEGKKGFFALLQDAVSASRAKDDLRERLRDDLLDALYNNDLDAYGYRTAPSVGRSPVRILADVFYDCWTDWDANSVAGLGARYEQVRIVDPKRLTGHPALNPPERGSRIAIESAIRAVAANPEFLAKDRLPQCDAVRSYLAGTGFDIDGNRNGLSDQNIAKLIVKVIGRRRISSLAN